MNQEKTKPNAPSCERNREHILKKIKPLLEKVSNVLEIGSGTGQHGVFFAQAMPWLQWQCTELTVNLDGIEAWRTDSNLNNLLPAAELDINQFPWPVPKFPAVFSANTLHIISDNALKNFFSGIGQVLARDGVLLVYGPFKYAGSFTSDSNERFDEWLKDRDSESGIKDFETVSRLAEQAQLRLECDHVMPANNQLLVWRKA